MTVAEIRELINDLPKEYDNYRLMIWQQPRYPLRSDVAGLITPDRLGDNYASDKIVYIEEGNQPYDISPYAPRDISP
jgi:hypothetical protein